MKKAKRSSKFSGKERRGGGVYCQFGEMEHATEESVGTREAMSRCDAGSESCERRQEILKDMMENKTRLQSRATEKLL